MIRIMQMKRALLLSLLATYASAQLPQVATGAHISYGPKACIHLTRSTVGSCVISTSCEGLDTSATEFAFLCVTQNGAKRHSYGIGGFESIEEFDSEVKCDICETSLPHYVPGDAVVPVTHQQAPEDLEVRGLASEGPMPPSRPGLKHALPTRAPDGIAGPPPGIAHSTVGFRARLRTKRHDAIAAQQQKVDRSGTDFWPFTSNRDTQEEKKPKEPKEQIVKTGPKDCVSISRDARGECVMQTACHGVHIADYEFGLLCVDKAGVPVRHTFGKGAFGKEEKFDTLIACEKCAAIDDAPKSAAASGLASVAKEVKDLTAELQGLSANLQKLNDAVFKPPVAAQKSAVAPAAAHAPAPSTAASLLDKTKRVTVGGKISWGGKASALSQMKKASRVRKEADSDDEDDDDANEDESGDDYGEEQEDSDQGVAQKQMKEESQQEDEDADDEGLDAGGADDNVETRDEQKEDTHSKAPSTEQTEAEEDDGSDSDEDN